jgi:glutamyl/glutaminyl-tRNA synthetase
LDYDFTFKQSDRTALYKSHSDLLVQTRAAVQTDGAVILEDTVIMKSNGLPTYNFASVIDDMWDNVTHIIRGTDHIPNLELQKKIWSKLRAQPFPEVIHVGLLFQGNTKLSKRNNTGNVQGYSQYNREALLNWLLRLGWSMPDPNFDKSTPLVDREFAKNIFWGGNFQSSPSKINVEKLKWYDRKYRAREKANSPTTG